MFQYSLSFLDSLVANIADMGSHRIGSLLTHEDDAGTNSYLKYLTLAAPPSAQAAHYLARTVVLRFAPILDKQTRAVGLETLEDAFKTSALGVLAANINLDEKQSSKKASFYVHNSSAALQKKFEFFGIGVTTLDRKQPKSEFELNPTILFFRLCL